MRRHSQLEPSESIEFIESRDDRSATACIESKLSSSNCGAPHHDMHAWLMYYLLILLLIRHVRMTLLARLSYCEGKDELSVPVVM